MKLVTFRTADREGVGRVDDDGTTIRDLAGVVGDRSMLAIIADWERLGPAIADAGELPVVDGARLRAPIPEPRRNLFCVGKNYREHVAGVRPQRLRQPGPLRGHAGEPGRLLQGHHLGHRPVRRHRVRTRTSPASWTTRPSSASSSAAAGAASPASRRCRARVGLHDHRRLHRPRPAARPQAVAAGQVAGHALPDGALRGDRRRDRRRDRAAGRELRSTASAASRHRSRT